MFHSVYGAVAMDGGSHMKHHNVLLLQTLIVAEIAGYIWCYILLVMSAWNYNDDDDDDVDDDVDDVCLAEILMIMWRCK